METEGGAEDTESFEAEASEGFGRWEGGGFGQHV